MKSKLIVTSNQAPLYPIVFESDYSKLRELLDELEVNNRKICIVTDSNVEEIYLNVVLNHFSNYMASVDFFTFQAGEESKTLDTARDLYKHLILAQFDREDILVALGGGVVGDLTGYVAATYLRGIRFIQMPTSLLSMVDSSIGGKTGVDFLAYKNMIGAFHQPSGVYINLSTLSTLSSNQFASGMAEIIKHGLLAHKDYYKWLKVHSTSILKKEVSILREMIYESCNIKKMIVERDPKEKGERALLNLGHTIGHAIEKLMNFSMLHGECVAVGCVAAVYLSYKKGTITKTELEDVKQLFQVFQLPVTINGIYKEDILRVTKSDKKMTAGKIKFILLKQLGCAYINETITDQELLEAIDFILESK